MSNLLNCLLESATRKFLASRFSHMSIRRGRLVAAGGGRLIGLRKSSERETLRSSEVI